MTVTRKREAALPMLEFDYPWIRAWGAYIDATRPMIEQMLEQARAEGAPETVLWWYPPKDVLTDPWDPVRGHITEYETVPGHWEDLSALMHGTRRQTQITDQRIFLWDWGMSRSIHVPDEILRAWLGEVILE